jgi:hypothetical protein
MSRRNRTARGAGIAIALTLALAAPAAAAQPTRTVIPATTFVTQYAAGQGCDFAVTAYKQPGSRMTITEFSDGTLVFQTLAMHRRIVNDATGAEYETNSVYHEVDRVDGNGIDHGTASGQFVWQFYPGDRGPDGVILDHVLALDIVGRATYVVDWNTGQTLQISIVGTVTDVCAALA